MPSGRRKGKSLQPNEYDNESDNEYGNYDGDCESQSGIDPTTDNVKTDNISHKEIPGYKTEETEANKTYRYPNDELGSDTSDINRSVTGSTSDDRINGQNGDNIDDEQLNARITKGEFEQSLNALQKGKNEKGSGIYNSAVISSLMDTYLNNDYRYCPPTEMHSIERPRVIRGNSIDSKLEELDVNLKNLKINNTKKQPPPPVRQRPPPGTKLWQDPKDVQRPKNREKQWPPTEEPRDVGAYVSESYGQTDPYSNKLIKDIQKSKREEEERRSADKRSEVVPDNIKPVSALRSTFTYQPSKPSLGKQRPESNVAEERSWIKHEKKQINFDAPPDEPDWMKLIRNRRWKSTVKARFPCTQTDKTEFERRSTTPKNWKRLAQDKNALKMLSEVVGIGAEGEELFMRLAAQRQRLEEEQEKIDKLAEDELMAYEVARESLGEDAAYQLQMDNPLPAARMLHLGRTASVMDGGNEGNVSDLAETLSEAGTVTSRSALGSATRSPNSDYPFTTSQLEAAYLTNQLLRLHPEEFKKLMSLERSRQATLRWQFSSDPFDSVHEHQSLPYEIAMLATQEPRVQQAMRKILEQHQGDDDYSSVFHSVPSSHPRSRRARSEGCRSEGYSTSRYESDPEGYDSSSSAGGLRGRPKKKKPPIPPPKNTRGRSISPTLLGRKPVTNGPKTPIDDDREVQSHGLFNDEDLIFGDEVAKLNEMTSSLSRNIDDDLGHIEASIEDRKRGFFEERIRNENVEKATNAYDSVDTDEISSRRSEFIDMDQKSSVPSDPAEDLPKKRHKVRRISSDAQLNAVFGKRRQASQDNSGDEDEVSGDKGGGTKKQNGVGNEELTNLVQNITSTFR